MKVLVTMWLLAMKAYAMQEDSTIANLSAQYPLSKTATVYQYDSGFCD